MSVMFERYTEKARRVIFFALYEAREFDSSSIETEHLLLGLFREDKALANRFLPSSVAVESLRQRVRAITPVRGKISTAVDLPLSHESKRVLAYAAEEADLLKHKHVGTEHLLLALLREENCLATTLLRERGLTITPVREEFMAPDAGSAGELLQSKLLAYLESFPNQLEILAAASGIYVKPNLSPATKAFLYIEILSPSETLWDLRRSVGEQFGGGLRYFWLFDPVSHHVFIATPEAGLHEFKGDVLHTENPTLELPLAEVFS
jgi:hypothetical protein